MLRTHGAQMRAVSRGYLQVFQEDEGAHLCLQKSKLLLPKAGEAKNHLRCDADPLELVCVWGSMVVDTVNLTRCGMAKVANLSVWEEVSASG